MSTEPGDANTSIRCFFLAEELLGCYLFQHDFSFELWLVWWDSRGSDSQTGAPIGGEHK